MMNKQPLLTLQPTPSQNFRIVGRGERGNLAKWLDHSYALQAEGDVEAACNARFEAFQAILEAVEGEEVVAEEAPAKEVTEAVEAEEPVTEEVPAEETTDEAAAPEEAA